MITTCRMPADWATTTRTFDPPGTPGCGAPLPAEQWERGPWMCEACQAVSRARARQAGSSYVPMMADVLRVMNDYGVAQDDAVRVLGGLP